MGEEIGRSRSGATILAFDVGTPYQFNALGWSSASSAAVGSYRKNYRRPVRPAPPKIELNEFLAGAYAAPKRALVFEALAASLKRCPDTNQSDVSRKADSNCLFGYLVYSAPDPSPREEKRGCSG